MPPGLAYSRTQIHIALANPSVLGMPQVKVKVGHEGGGSAAANDRLLCVVGESEDVVLTTP